MTTQKQTQADAAVREQEKAQDNNRTISEATSGEEGMFGGEAASRPFSETDAEERSDTDRRSGRVAHGKDSLDIAEIEEDGGGPRQSESASELGIKERKIREMEARDDTSAPEERFDAEGTIAKQQPRPNVKKIPRGVKKKPS